MKDSSLTTHLLATRFGIVVRFNRVCRQNYGLTVAAPGGGLIRSATRGGALALARPPVAS